MKFTIHNLRMIKARFSSNGWVLAELFLVFIVMWFLCDSLGCMKYTFYRPLGYDIDHVYRLTTVRGGESRDTTLLDADKYLNILKRLEQEPTVEAASLSYWSLPMSGANSYNSLAVQDTIGVGGRMIYATGGYTRVFHMQEEQGRTFAALPIGINNVMLSQAIADAFKKRLPEFSLNTPLTWRGDTVNTVTQGGIVGSFRDYRYGDDAHWIFMLMSLFNEMQQLKDAMNAYDVPLMYRSLDLLKQALTEGQISLIEYFVETENIYKNLQAYMQIENQYQKVMANIYKNNL